MTKSKKNHFSDISLPVFISGGVLLAAALVAVFLFPFFKLQSVDDYQTLEQLVDSLAAGPKVSYGDPLISDAVLRYPLVLADDPRIGDNNAQVTIFVFSDFFDCESCRLQYEILKEVIRQYEADEVRLVWKGVASTPSGLLTQQAALCAHSQEQFWPYADLLFANQTKLNRQFYSEAADSLNLDAGKFDACLDEAQAEEKVYNNNIDATDLGIKSVPYFFIDNTPYEGVLSEIQLKAIITLLLNR